MSTIQRFKPDTRMSQAVIHGDTVYLAGQIPTSFDTDITVQTQEVLAKIDALMAELGGSKSDILSVQIWLADRTDFAAMNAVWDAWIDPQNPPARAACAVIFPRQNLRIEMLVIARNPRAITS